MATPIERTSIIKLVTALFNAAPGAIYLAELTSFFDASGGTNSQRLKALATALGDINAYTALNPASQTRGEFVSVFLTPFGLHTNQEAIDFITARFNAGTPKGQIAYEACLAINNSTAPSFAEARAILNNKTDVAEYFSVTQNIAQTDLHQLTLVLAKVTRDTASVQTARNDVDSGTGSASGVVFALTAGQDRLLGTSLSDTFLGTQANLGSLDSINGGAGTDNFALTTTTSAAAITGAQLTSVETLTITATGAADHVTTLTGVAGLRTIANNASTRGLTVTGVAAVGTVNVTNTAQATTVVYTDAAVAGAADVVGLSLSGALAGSSVAFNSATADAVGIETINLVATGAASAPPGGVGLSSNDASVGTLNISGLVAVSLFLGTNLTTTVKTVNAATATGAVTVAGFGVVANTVTGGTGDDIFLFGANYVGAEGAAALRDSVDGGSGRDTLGMNSAQAVLASTVSQANVTNVEIVKITDVLSGTVDFTKFTGVDTVILGLGAVSASSLKLNSGGTVIFGSDSASAVDFTVGGSGLSDSLTLNLEGADLLGSTGTTAFNGIEVLTINTGAPSIVAPATFEGAVKLNPTAGGGQAIVATGTNGLSFNGAVTAGSINAAALTGTLVVGGTAANAIVITGGINNDFISGSALADTISSGAGNDIVLGRAGADAIHVGTGTDMVVQGTGDSGTFAAPVVNIVSTTRFDVITGMAAGDQIDLTNVVRTVTFVSTLVGSAAADNTAVGVRGTYDATTGTFTGSETGADTLLNYDTDISVAVALEAIILVGYVNASTAASSGTGVFTLA